MPWFRSVEWYERLKQPNLGSGLRRHNMTSILWFGRDLRLADNPALAAPVRSGQGIVPLFVLDDEDAGAWSAGGASRWWLNGSLEALSDALRVLGTQLVLRHGKAEAVIDQIL